MQVGATYWSGQEPKFDGNVKVFKVRCRRTDRRQQAGEAARGGHAGAIEPFLVGLPAYRCVMHITAVFSRPWSQVDLASGEGLQSCLDALGPLTACVSDTDPAVS